MFVCLLRVPPPPFSLDQHPTHTKSPLGFQAQVKCHTAWNVGWLLLGCHWPNNTTEENLTNGMWQIEGSLAYEFPSPLAFLSAVLPSSSSTSAEIPWDKHKYLQRDVLCMLTPWCEVVASTLKYHTTLLHVFLASHSFFPQPNQYRLITPKLSVSASMLASGSAFWGYPGYGQLVSDVTNTWNEILKSNCSPLQNNRNLLLVLSRLRVTSGMQWLWSFLKLLAG